VAIKVTMKGDLAAIIKRAGKEVKEASLMALRETAIQGVAIVVGTISEPGNDLPAPTDTGKLRQSVRYRRTAKGGRIDVTAPHAAFLEYGTRPHKPPIAPLKRWAMRRLGLSEKEAYGVARAIQLKIAVSGTKPRFFVKRSRVKIEEMATENVIAAIRKVASKYGRR
jgi:hypothetical protein